MHVYIDVSLLHTQHASMIRGKILSATLVFKWYHFYDTFMYAHTLNIKAMEKSGPTEPWNPFDQYVIYYTNQVKQSSNNYRNINLEE